MDQKILKSVLTYNKNTGVFIWKDKVSRKTVVGKQAGGTNSGGYIVIGMGGKIYYAHRLAWLYIYGEMPRQIDHKNGDKKDNRISNLRECSSTQNIFNAKKAKNNSSGYKGVSWHEQAGKWEAYVCHNNKKIYLGLFADPEKAANAYLSEVKKLEPNYVRKK